MRISTTLIVFCVGISLFITIIGLTAISASQNDLHAVIGDNLLLESKYIMDKIDRDISVKITEFKRYSQNPDLGEFIVLSNNKFSQFPDVSEYINDKDKEWISTSRDEISPFMKNLLDNKISTQLKNRLLFYENQYGYPLYGEVFVTNSYGANIAQTGKTSDYRQDDESWWQNAKEFGMSARDVSYDESSGIYSIDIGIRINDDEGNFLGVIKIVMSINEIIKIINESEKASEYDTSKMGLFFSDGKVIYDSHMPESNYQVAPNFFDLVESKNGIFEFDPKIMPPQLFAYTTQSGYGEFSGFGWIFVNHLDMGEIFYEANQQRNILVLIMVTATLISISSGIIIARSISKPISRLKEITIKISKGGYGLKIQEEGPEEISSLGKSFNKMSEEILFQQNKLIKKEKLSAIGELSSRIAHDIRNPLSVIKTSLANMGTVKDIPQNFEQSMDRCDRAVDRITHQIEGVMDFLKASELHIESINLKKMFEELAIDIVQSDEIRINLPKNEVTISGDKIKLHSLFYNLITNAIQAMGNTGIITIRISDKSNNEIQIEVEDDGPSIPEDNLEKIFEPLFTTKQVGTGLGLASCKKIVEQHNGSISVKNNPTTFTITLPKTLD